MISAVSANENASNIPIEFKDLTPEANETEYFVTGAYEKYPTLKFDENRLSEEYWVGGISYIYKENSTSPNTYKNSVFNRSIDGNATIQIALNKNATGLIYFSFLNGTPLELNNGSVQYKLTDLERGHYTFSYYYSGDDNYNDGVSNMDFVIPSLTTSMTLNNDNITMFYKDGTKLEATLKDQWGTPLTNRNVSFTINGVKYQRQSNENGTASINLNTNPGKYDIITHYSGSTSTAGNISYSTLTVLPTITGEDITKIYKNGTQYYVKALSSNGTALANQTINFNINGVFYNRTTDANGSARLNINLISGDYIITAKNLNDNCTISNNITVKPTIISDDLIKIYKNESQFNVQALTTNGTPLANKNLTFNINGVFYNRTTDSEGNAKLNINLNPGTYIITTQNPNDKSKISNTITVTPYLFTADLVKYYKSSSRFTARLVDASYKAIANQNVVFKLNGVEYTRTTDNEGEASIAINLIPGEYGITTSSNGYVVNNDIKVLPTLIDSNPENSTINLDEGEFYNVTVIDGEGNPYPNQEVKFKYLTWETTLKTNENGTVSFEGNRINQMNELTIEYNGYTIHNTVLFKKYPYVIYDKLYDNVYSRIYENPDLYSYLTN